MDCSDLTMIQTDLIQMHGYPVNSCAISPTAFLWPQYVERLEWNLPNVLFNVVHDRNSNVVNAIVLIVKQFIWRKRYEKGLLHQIQFRKIIFEIRNSEKYNAIK